MHQMRILPIALLSHFGFQSVRELQRNGGGSESSPSGSAASPRLKTREETDAQEEERKRDLPLPNVEHKHPAGFLYAWWSVHWDIYNAMRNKASTQAATSYAEARQSSEGIQMVPKVR